MQSFSVSDFDLLGIDAGLGSGSPSGASSLAPTAALATPVAETTLDDTKPLTSIDITFTDLSGSGLDTSSDDTSILSSLQKFTVLLNGQPISGLVVNPVPTAVVGEPGTYRFTLTGFPTGQAGTVTIEFLPGSFADGAGTTDVGSTAEFFLAAPVGGAASATGPTATLSSPAPGEAVTAAALNAAGYIDITYASHNGSPIDESFLNTLAPFTITGTGAANVKSISGVLQLVGAPEALDGGSTTDTSVTYRYFLVRGQQQRAAVHGGHSHDHLQPDVQDRRRHRQPDRDDPDVHGLGQRSRRRHDLEDDLAGAAVAAGAECRPGERRLQERHA